MLARIYQPPKNAMQSGKANTKVWVLEFEPASARWPDPLMGWTQTTDLNGQVKLPFDTREEAVAYANKYGIPFRLDEQHGLHVEGGPAAAHQPLYRTG